MKIKEIYVEAKRSKNFQTITAGTLIQIEEGEDHETARKIALEACNKTAQNKLNEILSN